MAEARFKTLAHVLTMAPTPDVVPVAGDIASNAFLTHAQSILHVRQDLRSVLRL